MPWVKEDFKSLKIFKQWGVYQNRYSRCGSSLHTSRFNQRWYQDENIFFWGDLRSISNTIPWHPKTMELWCVSLFRWDPPNQSALVSGVRWSNRNAYGYTPEISGSCWCYIAISLWSIYIYILYICVWLHSLCIYIYCFISPIHIYSVNWSLRCVGRTLTSGKWITTMLGFETLRPCKPAQPYLCNDTEG